MFSVLAALPYYACAQGKVNEDSLYIVRNYDKREVMVKMRDGVELFTTIYSPKSNAREFPILLFRTPYSVRPYGENYKKKLGPSMAYTKEKFIFVYQDVRGRFMSEGDYVNMTPHVANKKKKQVDESTDTYDTIEWLLKHVDNHNGKVGQWGISYPGFYTAAGAIDGHDALVAVSPQAPIADWFWDDFHHNGAFFLPHSFNFISVFGQPRRGQTKKWGPRFKHGTKDGYRWFLEEMGPLSNANTFLGDSIAFWNEMAKHPNYDEFWKKRNILPHLKNIKAAVLTVGGWFDAEDLYGPLSIYQTIEKNNPDIDNMLVMGPWVHGGWNRTDGTSLGDVWFGDDPKSSKYYHDEIELPFFNYYLKGKKGFEKTEARVFDTGLNKWREFEQWPPVNLEVKHMYFRADRGLSFQSAGTGGSFDEFVSNPDSPVPFTQKIAIGMPKTYMVEDQRFASRRPDVLVYQTEPLSEEMTLAGGIMAHLKVSTTGTAADWIVKLIDVYPDNHENFPHNDKDVVMGGYQQMVRSEVIRGRFRNSFEKPEPFVSGEMADINLKLQDVLHTFKKGHRLMIQVQSTWFPLVDRNPQTYVDNIFEAKEEDFVEAIHRVYRTSNAASGIEVKILPTK